MFILETDIDTGDGLELCTEIRRTPGLSLIPIVIVSHRSREWDVVAGLQAGADDYITKPFRERELLARIDASLRRCYELSRPRLVQFDAIEINSDAITLTVRGRRHQLAPAEFRLLDYLVHNPGRAFSRDHLLGIIRSRPKSVKHRMIDVIVNRIRYAIEPDHQHPKYLRTVKGFGYSFYLPKSATGIESRAKQRGN
jgi:DNA-binding response OmpR family regulator